jgi:hypothetical protein
MTRRVVLVFVCVIAGCQPAAPPFPRELVSFTQVGDGPVFAGAPGQWDAAIRERGWIVHENGIYKLWYTGYDGTKSGRRMLGYATSPDGLTWSRHPGNPLRPDLWIEDVMIVRDGEGYLMFAEGERDRAHMLTSGDGITWTPAGRLDIRLANGDPIPDGPFGTPTVLRDHGRWYLFYERSDKAVWLAVSDDLQVWRNFRDEPVLTPGPDAYDRDMIAVNQVIKHAGRYYAYYHGCATAGPDARQWSPAVAASDDLLHWHKYPGNPLLPATLNRSSGLMVHADAGPRFWTTHPAVWRYATRN